mmetsp:Transcript_28256/g.68042  ORF Transcript_28256/g.68042 Transcript_28256/m.68042 type:complete len:252 (+) Transcript_28256:253-1008(+)
MAMARILHSMIVFAANLDMGRILSLAVARGVVRALGIQAGIPHFVIAALIFTPVRIGKGARSALLPPSPIVPLPDALPLHLELQQRRHGSIDDRATPLPRRRRVAAAPAPVAPLVYAIVVAVGVTEHHGVLQQREGRAETIDGRARARLLVLVVGDVVRGATDRRSVGSSPSAALSSLRRPEAVEHGGFVVVRGSSRAVRRGARREGVETASLPIQRARDKRRPRREEGAPDPVSRTGLGRDQYEDDAVRY